MLCTVLPCTARFLLKVLCATSGLRYRYRTVHHAACTRVTRAILQPDMLYRMIFMVEGRLFKFVGAVAITMHFRKQKPHVHDMKHSPHLFRMILPGQKHKGQMET